jgi:hypothetical protein
MCLSPGNLPDFTTASSNLASLTGTSKTVTVVETVTGNRLQSNATFKLNTVGRLPWDASSAEVKSTLESITGIGTVLVSRSRIGKYGAFSWLVTFTKNDAQSTLHGATTGNTHQPTASGDIAKIVCDVTDMLETGPEAIATFTLTSAQVINEDAGVTVTQGTATGVLKTTLGGSTLTVVVHIHSGTFDTLSTLTIGLTGSVAASNMASIAAPNTAGQTVTTTTVGSTGLSGEFTIQVGTGGGPWTVKYSETATHIKHHLEQFTTVSLVHVEKRQYGAGWDGSYVTPGTLGGIEWVITYTRNPGAAAAYSSPSGSGNVDAIVATNTGLAGTSASVSVVELTQGSTALGGQVSFSYGGQITDEDRKSVV